MVGRKRRAITKESVPPRRSCRKKLKLNYASSEEEENISDSASIDSDDSEFWSPVPAADPVPAPAPPSVPIKVKGTRKQFEVTPKQSFPLKTDAKLRIEDLNQRILTNDIQEHEYLLVEKGFSLWELNALKGIDEQTPSVNGEQSKRVKFKYEVILTEKHTEAEESFQTLVPIKYSNYEAQNFIVSTFEKLSTRHGADFFVSRQNVKNPCIEESQEYDLSFLDKLPRTTIEQKMEYVSDQPAPSSASQESQSCTDSQQLETEEGPSSASQLQAEQNKSQEKYVIPTRMPENFNMCPYTIEERGPKTSNLSAEPSGQNASQVRHQFWVNERHQLVRDIEDPGRIMSKYGKMLDYCKTMLNEEIYYRRALKWSVTNNFLTGGISNLRTQLHDDKRTQENCKKECLPSRYCIDMWNEILEEDGLETKFIKKGSGWLLLTTMFSSLVGRKWHPPDPAINKIMLEIEKCDDACMRMVIFTNLLHTFSHLRAGPVDEDASNVYLHCFNIETLDKRVNRRNGDLDASWSFLAKLLEVEPLSHGEVWTRYDEVNDREDGAEDNSCALRSIFDFSSSVLLLSFLVQILETDWRLWIEEYYVKDKIAFCEESENNSHQPLALKMLFSKEGDTKLDIRWNKRCKTICEAYIKYVVSNPDGLYLTYLRRLLAIVAEILSMNQIANNKLSSLHCDLLQMTKLLANLFFDNKDEIDEETLKQELYLITPAWLSSQISTFFLCLIARINITSKSAELSDIVAMFVNVQTYESTEKENKSENECSAGDSGSTEPTKTPTSSKKTKTSGNTRVKAILSTATGNKKTVYLDKRNQYGEFPLHLACRRRNLPNIRAILSTTGVNVNVTDNNLNTPLHEAVEHGFIDVVKELLNFKPPYPSVQNFFSPKAETTSLSNHVNILAFDAFGESPLHYAINKKNAEMLRVILQFVEDNQDDNNFPSLVEVMLHHHYKGVLLINLSDDPDINSVLSHYQSKANQLNIENGDLSKATTNFILKSTFESQIYQDLLKNSIIMYMAGYQVYTAYRMYKNLCNSSSTHIHVKYPKEMERYPPVIPNFKPGQTIQRFIDGKEDVYNYNRAITNRLNAVKNVTCKDIKCLEDMLYYWMYMNNCDMGNKILIHLDLFYPEHCTAKKI